MSASKTATAVNETVTSVFEAYAQLVKMLLPSSGCLAIYAVDGDLAWSSEGFERPDFRELVDDFRNRNQSLQANQGVVRETNAGANALIARLADVDDKLLGFALIELGRTQSNAGKSMAASMTRPLMSCLAAQLGAEQASAAVRVAAPPARKDPRLTFLLGLSELNLSGLEAIGAMLNHCLDGLDCLSAVFCVPGLDLTEFADRSSDAETRAQLDATRKHLLAWVQLNNKPMVVNRVDGVKSPYKILSCPVVDVSAQTRGLMALFRSGDQSNFELDDVRLVEFLSKQGMALLAQRQDTVSGLLNRTAFEHQLDAVLADPRRVDKGTVLYIDISDLKAINAEFGFEAGDEAILRTAQLIRRLQTPGETACRLAGDRFAIYLPERDRDGAETLGAELATSAQSLGFAAAGRRVPVNLRYGAAGAPNGKRHARHWIAAAEYNCQQGRAKPGPNSYNGASDPHNGE